MRVLQPIWDGGGNVAPQLAIARALAERGHQVQVLGDPCQRERVQKQGVAFRAYRHAPSGDASNPATDLLRDWEAKTPIGAFARVRDRLMYGPCALFARDVLDALEEDPADVVLWDYLLIGAGIGAERAGVRSVAAIHTVYPLPTAGVPPFGLGLMPAGGALGGIRDAVLTRVLKRMFRPGLKPANQARSALGLAPIDTPFDQLTRADLALILTSPSFDFAGRAALPENVRFAGPIVDAAAPGSWESPWPADDGRPLVLVSFSTTYMDQQDLAQRTLDALADLPVRGLLTTGPAMEAAELTRPDNVEIREYVPHAAVLADADLVITHAGMGTVHAALAAGVPVVCMPGGRDQDDIAARVVFHGAGAKASQGASPRRLRRIVARTLADPSYRSGAERMAKAFAGQDGAARAAEELESLAGAAAVSASGPAYGRAGR